MNEGQSDTSIVRQDVCSSNQCNGLIGNTEYGFVDRRMDPMYWVDLNQQWLQQNPRASSEQENAIWESLTYQAEHPMG